jgi:hypothetical protein
MEEKQVTRFVSDLPDGEVKSAAPEIGRLVCRSSMSVLAPLVQTTIS